MNGFAMSTRTRNWLAPTRAAVAVAAVLGASAAMLQAGDPIILPGHKSKTEPAQSTPFGKEIPKGSERIRPGPAQEETPAVVVPPTRLDPKRARQLKNERDERRNWMFVEEGELQNKGKDDFGIRSYSLDDLEKKDHRGDYTFKDVGRPKNQPQTRTPNAADDEVDAAWRKSTAPGNEPDQGAHTARELNLRNLLGPGENSVAPAAHEQPEFTLKELFNNPAAVRAREQQTRHEAFKAFLDGPRAPAATSGLGSPSALPGGLDRPPLGGASPKPSVNSITLPGVVGNPARAASPAGVPGLGDGPSRISGFSSLPSPAFQQAEPPRAWTRPSSLEPPKRKL
jgi:hypothetical protein